MFFYDPQPKCRFVNSMALRYRTAMQVSTS